MSKTINLKNLKKPMIVAEIGLSHHGRVEKAKNFIDACKNSGADVVKFQTHIAEYESTYDEPFRINLGKKFKNRFDYWTKTSFKEEDWKKIVQYCKKKKIYFQTSPFSVEAVQLMRKVGCKNWKLGSGEVFDTSIISEILKKKMECLILSSGLSTIYDVEKNISYLKKKTSNFAVLQCTSSYPCKLENVGVNIINYLRSKHKIISGLSDHTGNLSTSVFALAKGANVIEVHVCYDKKNDVGPDVTSSLNFNELSALSKIRDDFEILKNNNQFKKKLTDKQKKIKKIFTKSLSLKEDLQKGKILKKMNITLKKPGNGLKTKDISKIIGKKAKYNLSRFKILKFRDFV